MLSFLAMDADVLADELAGLIRAMGKGPYLVFCEALKAAGGEVSIDPDELAREAHRMPPRCEVDTSSGRIVVRLVVV